MAVDRRHCQPTWVSQKCSTGQEHGLVDILWPLGLKVAVVHLFSSMCSAKCLGIGTMAMVVGKVQSMTSTMLIMTMMTWVPAMMSMVQAEVMVL